MGDTPVKNRLTVVESVYFQEFGEQPQSAGSRFSRNLESDEQPYSRKLQATSDWKPLDCGWLAGCPTSSLVISNDEGKHRQSNPTEEEREELAGRVLEIWCSDGITRTMHSPPREAQWLVSPGESMRAYPVSADSLFIRCKSGTACFNIRLYPG